MQLFLLLVLLFNLLSPADLSAGVSYNSLYQNLTSVQQSYWLKLLHYHNDKSRADGDKFFLSPTGKTDPAAELEATINAFRDPVAKSGWFDYHPQCVFRERYNFLKSAGLINNISEKSCVEFTNWKNGLNAKSITLVFSSSYPNNPSSLFGHTLIRLNQKEKTSNLLDYSVAFSAIPVKDDIGLVFALKGIFGGYKGILEVSKYYTKVNEYNDGESRDLMEYEIKMTPDELDRLINHLWEIYQTTYFDYFFTDENCSAVLVDILAVPFNLDNINSHQRWYYLPSEMIKAFRKIPGRILAESFRPSLKKQLEKKLEKLTPEEVRAVRGFSLDSKTLPIDYSNIAVLDATASMLDFTRYRTKDNLSSEQKVMFRKSLLRRATLAQDTSKSEEIYEQNNRPDLGHEPQKISIFSRTEDTHLLLGIELKQGYHDLMSNDLGYDPFSQFDYFTGSFIYDKNLKQFNYDQLTFVDLVSLHTYKFYDPQFSWALKIVSDRIYELDCQLCHRFNARAYMGPTFRAHSQTALSFMGGLFGEASKHYEKGTRVGLGFEGSYFLQISDSLKMGFIDELRFDASHRLKKDYYNNFRLKFSYFSNINNEWRLESSAVSKFRGLETNSWINQINYGYFF
jgi:hypothetical protein